MTYKKRLKRQPIFREDGLIEIKLTRGYVALIDEQDSWAAKLNWSSLIVKSGMVYAIRGGTDCKLLHRVIMGLGKRDGRDVDHKNGDTLNCTRINLRIITHRKNTYNRKMSSHNTSGFMGVSFHQRERRWSANISGKRIGMFKSPEAAHEARLFAEKLQWGIQPLRKDAHDCMSMV